jgi:hypothetical protein
MKQADCHAILASFIDRLQQAGIWCNEFRLHKTTFLLQELLGVPLQLPFIFYKHGPFCFELMDELTAMQAYRLLAIEYKDFPWGPAFVVTPRGREYCEWYPATIGKYNEQLTVAVQKIGHIDAFYLERMAGVFFLSRDQNGDVVERARRLHERTPHVPLHEAKDAVILLDQLLRDIGVAAKVEARTNHQEQPHSHAESGNE